MKRTLLAVVVFVAVGVGAVALALFPPATGNGGAEQYLTTTAARTNVVKQAVANGTISPSATYSLGFGGAVQLGSSSATATGANSGNGGASWTVTEVRIAVGDHVTKGQVLAVADATAAEAELAVAEANLAAAQARLEADRAGLTGLSRASAQDQVKQARNQLTAAQRSLSDTRRQNNLSISQAQAALSRARSRLASDTKANAPSAVLDADRSAVTAANEALASTRVRAAASNNQAARQVTSASLSYTAAQNAYKLKLEPATAAQIASDEAAVATAEQAAQSARATLDGATIEAPADGVVTAVAVRAGFVAPSGAAITMQDSHMQVVAPFAEADLPSLKTGQSATVSVSALGQQLTGTLAGISPVAATSGSSSVVSYEVTVDLGQVDAAVASGMSAEVAVSTAEARDVIAIPPSALSGNGGQYAVRVVGPGGQLETRQVGVGLTTNTLAEITDGLAEGETVVIGTASVRQTSTSTGGGFGIPGFGPGVRQGTGGGNRGGQP